MVWGIIGALDAEVALLRDAMQVVEQFEDYGTTFYCGTLEGQQICLACCSVGTINAALCASLMIREHGATHVVNVGIAGAADERLRVLDVVLCTEAVLHDREPLMKKYYPFALRFQSDSALLTLAERACRNLSSQFAHYQGVVATGDVFVQGGETKDRIVRDFAPMCVEMEGAAIAQACLMNHTPFLVIRTMSDNADSEADITYDEFLPRAAAQSAAILHEMLRLASATPR